MSYTILTIPFEYNDKVDHINLDDYLHFHKKSESKSSAFLHYAEFDKAQINRALVCVFLKNISESVYKEEASSTDFLAKKTKVFKQPNSTSFIDRKYLAHVGDFVDPLYTTHTNVEEKISDSVESIANKLLLNSRKFSILHPNKEFEKVTFDIDSIKIYFNRSKFNPEIRFGFVSIVLKWDVNDAYGMIETVSEVMNHLRYFIKENDTKAKSDFVLNTDSLFDEYLRKNAYSIVDKENLIEGDHPVLTCSVNGKYFTINGQDKFYQREKIFELKTEINAQNQLCAIHEVQYFELEGQNKLLRVESLPNLEQNFRPLRGDIKLNSTEFAQSKKSLNEVFGLKFHKIIDELILSMFEQNDPKGIISFHLNKQIDIKPHFLHLSLKMDDQNVVYLDSDDFQQRVYKMLRIPDDVNFGINKWNFIPENPDTYTRIYTLNEGAVVIEGKQNNDKNQFPELINKYYPALLFALNQKYLFHHFQGKIGDLKVNGEDFEPESLKSMKAMMIKGEFYQVFTLISNYNEIDSFFQNLRAKFNIKELKEEYLDSINGLEKLASLEAEKKEKKEKLESEDREKLRSERIDNAVILLTFAQVIAIYFAIVDDFKIVFLCLVTIVLILSLDALFNEKSFLQRILNFLKKKTDI